MTVLLALTATRARADVAISSDVTQNMSCLNGVCAPTGSDAILNVTDLEALLASGDITVTTTGSGVQADNIDVDAKLSWSGTVLALDAYQSIAVGAAVTVKGRSGLSLVTNDGGSGGELTFGSKGHIAFKNLSSKLTINGTAYMLTNTIRSLAGEIANNPNGSYAFVTNYNAGQDGTYKDSPILTAFTGRFEGLGNAISNLTIDVPSSGTADIGFITELGATAQISDFGLKQASVIVEEIKGKHSIVSLGAVTGSSGGLILRCSVSGNISVPKKSYVGGLVGNSGGTIEVSRATINVRSKAAIVGGLAGENEGLIDNSYARGSVSGTSEGLLGGLVGINGGTISDSYASGSVSGGLNTGGLVGFSHGMIVNTYATGNVSGYDSGGLVGANTGGITASYSTGAVTGSLYIGGLIGVDDSTPGSLTDTYWDTDTSGITNLSQGAGNVANDPGITGLTTAQLQSGLPAGFDPTIWAETSNINGGLPYLIANPPPN